MNRVSMSITGKGKRWEILHSLWIGWTFTLGFFNWIAFLYIGIRARQRKWLLWGLFYSIPFIFAMVTPNAMNWLWNVIVVLTIVLGIIGILHAFRIRNEYLFHLVALQRKAVEKNAALRQRFDVEMGRSGESHGQRTVTSEGMGKSTLHPSSEEPEKPFDQPPEDSPSHESVPPLVAVDDLSDRAAPEQSAVTSIPTDYPLPLAYAYRLADAEFETFRVLKELYRNAEGLTAFLTSLALCLAPTPTGKRRDTLLRAWRGRGATFGSWYAILEKTAPTIDEGNGKLYRSMKGLLGTKANPSSFAETMTWLIDRRNDLHHGDLPVGPRAGLLIQEVRGKFEHCVSESAALWQHPLRLVLDYDAVRNKDYVVATCLDFSGDHPVGRKVQERYQGIPKKQDLYILQDGRQWISLYPFVSVHYCPHCNARETYFVDAWHGSGEEANLRSFERAHEEVSEEIGQELTFRLGS